MARRPELPDTEVPAALYDDDYYRYSCLGSDCWRESGGRELDPLYEGVLELAGLCAGEAIVDLGTGRGELLVAALRRGAGRVVGVEYSADAVRLSHQTLAAHGLEERAEVLHSDVRRVPADDGCADLVTLLDVVEHLAPSELDAALAEARRLLRPGGRLLIHTMPSRTIYAVTYRLQRAWWPPRKRRWPADPRNRWEHLVHVNEQTPRGLARTLRRAGFTGVRVRPGDWVYTDFVPDEGARKLYHRLAARRPTQAFGVADIWAHARRE
jgi:ubiquinone/menaquinone biosynthesis C-methylase UbiE